MFSRLDTIPACDGQTDGRTPHDNEDRAMQSVARIKSSRGG